ncbi:cobalamin biosynthesis protein CobT [Mucor ambiguus]|uniref:Cobalamin biosynthesis protein CobT n=1 Tax=Mucor ambiguus TaxID=91626 RepID=A0A0C9LW70_9FUNG|nr:cobalamin biosynthesis protein CobT [Mucor ambiguus]
MGSSTSKNESTSNIIVDLYASETTNQLLKTHLTNQRIADVLKHPTSTISSTTSTSSATMSNANEHKSYASLVNRQSIPTRVWVAQCKIYGFGTQMDVAEGFRELQQLKDQKEAFYPLACHYYDQHDYVNAYQYFYRLRKDNHSAQYRIALMLFHGQGIATNHQKAFHYMKFAANNGNKYAQFIMGFYYEYGILVKQSTQTSKTWYERSASQGFAEAQTAMANLLINDIDVVVDDHKLIEISSEHHLIKDQALGWLSKAIEQENASALIRLGALHEEGILVERDDKKTIEYYTRAANAPYASTSILSLAHYLVGINYRLGDLGLEQDFGLALENLTLSADAGYAPAQRALGLMYAEGIGAPKDDIKATLLFEKAANQGDIRSLGLLTNQRQQPQASNLASALSLYEKAAKAGSLAAQLSLAELLQRTGQHAVAFRWFETASKNAPTANNKQQKISILDFSVGFVSQRNLARLMVARYRYNGWGSVKQDRLWAFEEFRTLSINGYPDAHYWLAACYEEGVVQESDGRESWIVKPDLDLAFGLYTKAAEAGDMDGQFQMAYMLSNGIGVPKHVDAAFPWYTKAAEQGHKTAQYSLGMYYENGLGIAVDLNKAKQWFELAAEELPMAMVRLAKVLMRLDGSKETIKKATDWLKKAIEQGDVTALREMATMYKNGLIDLESTTTSTTEATSLDGYRTAFSYFQQAADKDDALSWHALSKFYEGYYNTEDEMVVPASFGKAVMCLKKAEGLGYAPAVLDLADLYYRNEKIDETMLIYSELATSKEEQPCIIKKARIEAAKIVILENYGNEQDQIKVYLWLLDIIKRDGMRNLGELCEVHELLGYCAENGIGTNINKDEAIVFYEDCVNEDCHQDQLNQHKHWAKERSLCRLVYRHMDGKDYLSTFKYLGMLSPSLERMGQLPSADASMHTRRMKYFLGYLYMHGHGVEKDTQESLRWLADAADGGDGDAAYEIGMHLSDKQDDLLSQEIRRRFQQGALAGHAGCMRELAFMLLADEMDQSFLDEDYDGGAEILDLLQTASRLGDAKAMYRLGQAYENGLGDVIPEKVLDKALECYMDAAESNHEEAMLKAGEILGNALGRHEEAIQWFQKAAEKFNSIQAKVMLISYSFQGMAIDSRELIDLETNGNDSKVFEQLKTLVDGELNSLDQERHNQETEMDTERDGLGLAFYILGQCFELGRGTSANLPVAKEWYHRSVLISENVDAMWRLGVIHSELEDDYISALQWYQNAAEKGKHRESHFQLGIFHLRGIANVEVNLAVAKKHFSKAAEQGHPMATYELGRIVWYKDADHLYGYELFKVAAQQLHVPAALRELGNLSHTGFSLHGIEVCEQDHKVAFAYYCEAARLGDPIAALMVGNYFEEGYLKEELGQNSERALQWYESAYRMNCGGLSELAIGKLKHTIADTMQDAREADDMREEAIVWFESAAHNLPDDANFSARIMIALYQLNGWGRKKQDAETGLHMLLEIAEADGCCDAIVLVAQCYEEGVGTEYDMNKAFHYWKMAAELNSARALERLGDFYALGLTGQIDKSLANEYYHRAKTLIEYHCNKRHSGYSLESFASSLSASQ